MPLFVISTNVAKADVPPEFMTEMTSLISRLTGKPEKYICVQVVPDQMMTWEGTADPCAQCHFHCLGKISMEENKKYTAAFSEFVNRKLKLAVNRMYVFFHDSERENVGWNGTTFA